MDSRRRVKTLDVDLTPRAVALSSRAAMALTPGDVVLSPGA